MQPKLCKYHGISVICTIFKKCKNIVLCCIFPSIVGKMRCIYSVLWPCTVACTVRALCTVQNTMCVHPLYFHQQNAIILLLEVWRHTIYISAPCKIHQDTQLLISNCCPHVEQMLQCCFFVWWVAALKMKLHLDYFGMRFWQIQREFVQICVCTSINQNNLFLALQKNSNPPACGHITPDPPAPP